jgi:hypothetical protein
MDLIKLHCSCTNLSHLNATPTAWDLYDSSLWNRTVSLLIQQQCLSPYARNVLTVALISCRHMGQSCRLGAQLTQVTRCPQGRKTTPTSSSIQILHRRASLRRRTSSSNESATPSSADWSVTYCDRQVKVKYTQGVELYHYLFLTLALDSGEWSA